MAEAAELQPHIYFEFPPDEPAEFDLLELAGVEVMKADIVPGKPDPEIETEQNLISTLEADPEPDSATPKKIAASRGILRAAGRLQGNSQKERKRGKPWWGVKSACSNCMPGAAETSPFGRSRGCQNCAGHAAKSEHTTQH